MNAEIDYHTAVAMLLWQHDLGATEAMGDTPVDRYALAGSPPMAPQNAGIARQAAPAIAPAFAPAPDVDPVARARDAAACAGNLADLRATLAAFDLCELKRGARTTVFADGNPQARVMVIGDAPGREEDSEGRPFIGIAGQLLDRMFAAIGLGRDSPDPKLALYLTHVMPWRPPQDRDASPAEIDLMRPFLQRHVMLAAPDLIVAMGNTACAALLGARGITRLRGEWATGFGLPVLPMVPPAHLLRHPSTKREAWADLLSLQARLRTSP
ncbi:MAG: uracil-DNA glycosylase [Paracoccaceae bacterium]|nr:uracil-DNA glycosylase [Paracoccaceae bacterium]